MPIRFNPLPSAERIAELFNYDSSSGLFMRKISRGSQSAGAIAGTIDSYGYRQIKVDGRLYLASRLVFKLINGRDPLEEIDHLNGDKGDDRQVNLREASHAENTQNTGPRLNNRSGLKGIWWVERSQRWTAKIRANRKVHFLGNFKTADEAHAAYRAAALKLHGEFAKAA